MFTLQIKARGVVALGPALALTLAPTPALPGAALDAVAEAELAPASFFALLLDAAAVALASDISSGSLLPFFDFNESVPRRAINFSRNGMMGGP
ncbi:hypothetical protein BX666DRAFT_350216 [Dichotomocladium elegans]|nr:hypothetical protein BX666DRAFT_350216 [Dichotomocladium elegans]